MRKPLAASVFKLRPSLVENAAVVVGDLADAICRPTAYAAVSVQTGDILQTDAGGCKAAAVKTGALLPNTTGARV